MTASQQAVDSRENEKKEQFAYIIPCRERIHYGAERESDARKGWS